MASKNKLLGSGKPPEVEEKKVVVQAKAPAWRYHKTCPDGMVAKTDAKLAELDAAGWVDHPGKVKKLPGFESLAPKEEEKIDVDVNDLVAALADKESNSDLSGNVKDK